VTVLAQEHTVCTVIIAALYRKAAVVAPMFSDLVVHHLNIVQNMGALQRGPGGPRPSQNFGWVGHNAFGPTNNWPVCSLILHCGQLILRKISTRSSATAERQRVDVFFGSLTDRALH